MNIFVVDKCPITAAQMMIDKHVIKMATETLQMISTCLILRGFNAPYRKSFAYHPCTIWARHSKQNMEWLFTHAYALCQEYTIRYGKTHQVEKSLNLFHSEIELLIDYLPDLGLTEFAVAISDNMNCRQLDGFDEMDVVEKYRQYYIHDKWWFASWKTKEPDWWPKNHIAKMRSR
tara:strand:+ start:65 stop:589 length:525 start_codon:yes stop_codon:yes gene_type:complete